MACQSRFIRLNNQADLDFQEPLARPLQPSLNVVVLSFLVFLSFLPIPVFIRCPQAFLVLSPPY